MCPLYDFLKFDLKFYGKFGCVTRVKLIFSSNFASAGQIYRAINLSPLAAFAR